MGLARGDSILGSDIVALKGRVKKELQRRKYNGDISSYGGTDYDYTVTPGTGVLAAYEHIDKIITPLNQIIDQEYPYSENSLINALDTIATHLTKYEGEDTGTAGSSSCSSSCSGLCTTVCSNTCRGGCTYTCHDSCNDDCWSKCNGGCTAYCQDYCSHGGCEGGCPTTCEGMSV